MEHIGNTMFYLGLLLMGASCVIIAERTSLIPATCVVSQDIYDRLR